MKNFNSLRTLARSTHWQVIYSRSKEMNVNLFENTSDFTPVQINFMQWLEVYHSLEIELASKEPHLSREVIEDDIRCDAYLHLRQLKEPKKEQGKSTEEAEKAVSHVPSIVFKQGG